MMEWLDANRSGAGQTLPDFPPVDVDRVLTEAAGAYIADCRRRVAPFIDREGYLRYIDSGEARFRKLLAEQQRHP